MIHSVIVGFLLTILVLVIRIILAEPRPVIAPRYPMWLTGRHPADTTVDPRDVINFLAGDEFFDFPYMGRNNPVRFDRLELLDRYVHEKGDTDLWVVIARPDPTRWDGHGKGAHHTGLELVGGIYQPTTSTEKMEIIEREYQGHEIVYVKKDKR